MLREKTWIHFSNIVMIQYPRNIEKSNLLKAKFLKCCLSVVYTSDEEPFLRENWSFLESTTKDMSRNKFYPTEKMIGRVWETKFLFLKDFFKAIQFMKTSQQRILQKVFSSDLKIISRKFTKIIVKGKKCLTEFLILEIFCSGRFVLRLHGHWKQRDLEKLMYINYSSKQTIKRKAAWHIN